MPPRIAFVLCLTLLVTQGFAADKPFVRVRWKGESFRVTYKTAAMTYHLEPGHGLWAPPGYNELSMAQINKITTDYLEEKNGVVYMILNIEGNSRGEDGQIGQCGAGEEKGKGLFVFNEKGELKSPEFVVYQSCFSTIDVDISNDEPPAVLPAGKLLAEFELFRHPALPPGMAPPPQDPHTTQLVTVRAYFNEEYPEIGMTSVEMCVMFEPWIKSNQRVRCPSNTGK